MRLSELMHAEVVDSEGVPVGTVEEIRLVQDGPVAGGTVARPRVDGLIISHRGFGVRLGYHGGRMKGPWLIRSLLHWLERNARSAEWNQVAAWEGGTVRLNVAAQQLPRVTDAS